MVGQGTFSGNQRFEGMLSWKLLEPEAAVKAATRAAGRHVDFGHGTDGPGPPPPLRLVRQSISTPSP
jgi:hypothetical protein